MNTITWAPSLKRVYKKLIKNQPDFLDQTMKTIKILKSDPFYPSLKTHRLHGDLEGLYACSVKYAIRIVFDIMKNPDTEENEILLIDIGTHEEVY